MIFRYPAYYEKFACIADRCEDSCCAGWEIDIDDRSYRYYMSVPGEFGERLRTNIREYEGDDAYESHGFILKDGRCPFLNERNLCDLYTELGENALCSVCTNTPRNILEYGGERELALSASCPEAGRLIYGEEKKTTFVECRKNEELDFEESPEEMAFAQWIRRMRDEAVRILQDRTSELKERIFRYLAFSVWVQENINQDSCPGTIPDNFEKSDNSSILQLTNKNCHERFSLFLQRMLIFTQLECISEAWQQVMTGLNQSFVQPEDERGYCQSLAAWELWQRQAGKQYEYEQLLVYYVFMCQSRCVDDYDFLGKTKLVLVSFIAIRDMDTLTFLRQGTYDFSDRVRNARIYAREVEHSQNNLDQLAEAFLFEEAFSVENLRKSL